MLVEDAKSCGGTHSLPLMKVRAKSKVQVVIQSHRPQWVAVHWFGRQVPCAGEACPGCAFGQSRVRGYFVATLHASGDRRPWLVECTPGSMSALAGLQTMCGEAFEPGVVVELSRAKANSPLRIEPCEIRGDVVPSFAGEARVLRALAVIWALPLPQDAEEAEAWEQRVRPILRGRLKKVAG